MNPSITDGQAFKAGMRIQWDTAAAGWNAHTTDIRAWLRKPTDAMCRMAGVTVGSRVLDVAAGAGDQALDIAAQVGPQGHVLATDLSPAIVALAQVNAVNAGFGHVETRVADGEDLGVTEASFDVAVCRLGLMFFPDPLRGLREIHRALRPGGGVCTMVFSRPEKNPCLTILMSTALKHAGLPARDPFLPGGLLSLGQPGRIDDLELAALLFAFKRFGGLGLQVAGHEFVVMAAQFAVVPGQRAPFRLAHRGGLDPSLVLADLRRQGGQLGS